MLSKAPSTVVASIEVPLGDERDQITTKENEEFVHLRGEVARLLRYGHVDEIDQVDEGVPAEAVAD